GHYAAPGREGVVGGDGGGAQGVVGEHAGGGRDGEAVAGQRAVVVVRGAGDAQVADLDAQLARGGGAAVGDAQNGRVAAEGGVGVRLGEGSAAVGGDVRRGAVAWVQAAGQRPSVGIAGRDVEGDGLEAARFGLQLEPLDD